MPGRPPAELRLVVDTNLLVSRLLLPASPAARAADRAIREGVLLVSAATMTELADVLSREKFDRYVTLADRRDFLRLLARVAEPVEIACVVHACRDPADDKFLELAVSGRATAIVTGDRDLLALDPFRGVRVLSPRAWLARP